MEEVECCWCGEVAGVGLKPGGEDAAEPVGEEVSECFERGRKDSSLHLSESTEQGVRLESTGDEIEAFDEFGEDVERSCKAAVDDEEEGDVLLV